MKRICFVCLGNIVRSPLAEHLFKQAAGQRGLDGRYEAASAACGDWHVGEAPDARMRQVAAERGLVYTGKARQFKRSDFERYDLVLAMDTDNWQHLMDIARIGADQDKIHLLREFDPEAIPGSSVPDPYYGGLRGFEEVYEIIERSVNGLLDALEAQEKDDPA